ncbi:MULTISPECIES: class I SAM-dependent methyltransferase [unclassified Acinetobacter]|uniref:class I SAM-dependent methyltransferase n=1 Tax=unclassified Acinetobacter TaxID=196816 RepID=UPI0025761C93|nr:MULTISPECIES: class I SAM-dependent methyltransferase [unclassified Acinetobacter]MDM1763903.1 class I SAM-dependent methyltransferase [Acinetobacter sp. 226-1]MDM1767637.1 class I SAM-dependent methyltransferase [Acinetobacter sp. 226-4]
MNQQLSKHRHISFTAHYTGYIWYQMGISHPLLATSKGKSLAFIANPIETWAEKYVGGSMRTTLKERHTMLDDTLKQLIHQYPDLQVLEIAAGLSPRGWWFRKHFPHIDYRELDLPDMAKTKQTALQQIDPSSPQVLSVDLFTEDFKNAFAVFDPQRPLVIISEGLINYFEKDLLQQLLKSIVHYGQNFKALHYLTDIYPEPVKNKLASVIWNSSKLLKVISRSAFSFHFQKPQEIQDFFKIAGFTQVEVLQPHVYFQPQQSAQMNSEEHLGDLVWMIHAKT